MAVELGNAKDGKGMSNLWKVNGMKQLLVTIATSK